MAAAKALAAMSENLSSRDYIGKLGMCPRFAVDLEALVT